MFQDLCWEEVLMDERKGPGIGDRWFENKAWLFSLLAMKLWADLTEPQFPQGQKENTSYLTRSLCALSVKMYLLELRQTFNKF